VLLEYHLYNNYLHHNYLSNCPIKDEKSTIACLNIYCYALLVARIFLQVVDETKLKSENNAIKKKYEYPERGYL
jgi:hypothetical protein